MKKAKWVRIGLVLLSAGFVALVVAYAATRKPPPAKTEAIHARLELAAGKVTVDNGQGKARAVSGLALRANARVETDAGARALIRLPDGSTSFLRGGTSVALSADGVTLDSGEYWLDVPELERASLVHRAGGVTVSAAEAGLSIKRTDDGAIVYVARGMAVVSSEAGRVEVGSGEKAIIAGNAAPKVEPVSFWDDWTGGMADYQGAGTALGQGSGTIYGVDIGASEGSPARKLEIKRQSVRAVLRDGLSETEVDQTFFNPSERPVEGWYWFVIPPQASVTSFAVETNGQLVEGELIERREASTKYTAAKASGHAPAILEWVDGRSYRARIYPVPGSGTRRVVLRYIELRPINNGKLTYVYPMASAGARIGELSLTADLGDAGTKMDIATLDDARIEGNGRRVTMRRSGYTPRTDFQLEATIKAPRPPLTIARFETGGDSADYLLARFTPDVDWNAVAEPRADVVVVVDTSADGDEASRQLKATTAEAILRALSSGDRFALVSLDVRATVLHPEKGLAEASDGEIAKSLEQLAEHAAGGATDLAALFDASLGRVHGAEQPAVIYVGDGLATSGEMSGEQLLERLRRSLSTSRARLFTVGVGEGADHPLLGELARAGGGKSFRVDGAGEATGEALQLAAAIKIPTITDFELDLGAGLDEPFVNVSGKVPRGSDVLVLARTHHDLPKRATVRGRLAGEPFEREVEIRADKTILTAFVPRLWAAAYVRRLLGAAAGPEVERGRIASLGIEYGLMTPYTSILALESESAYRRMKIRRRRSPLRGVRLGALDARGERDVIAISGGVAPPAVAFGCRSADKAASGEPEEEEYERSEGSASPPQMAATAVAEVSPQPQPEANAPGRVGGSKLKRKQAALEDALDEGEQKTESGRRRSPPGDPLSGADEDPASPAPAATAPAPAKPRGRSMRPANKRVSRLIPTKNAKGGKDRSRRRPPPRRTCSDLARRPLSQRLRIWGKRLDTATSPAELIGRYELAKRACELEDWRAERAFLQLMQKLVYSEGGAKQLLEHFAPRPEVQQHVAKLILRRVVDQRVVAAVEGVLFGNAVAWQKIDLAISELEEPEARIEKLREAMARAPDDPNGQIRLVEHLAAAGRVQEALTIGRRLRDRGLLTLSIARQLGDVLARAELDAEAVRTYSEIVEFDPRNVSSRVLLGDIYLGHGWYGPAYRQYRTATEAAPNAPLAWLRLAAAAAGTGRIDEALRIERRVATAQGRPGPDDPRRWARLASAARIARLIAEPPKSHAPKPASLERKLKELGLFGTGPATLVLLTWQDLRADITLVTQLGEHEAVLGERTDAAAIGLSAVLLSPADHGRAQLVARLRSVPQQDVVGLVAHEIAWDGSKFAVSLKRVELAARRTGAAL